MRKYQRAMQLRMSRLSPAKSDKRLQALALLQQMREATELSTIH